MYILFLAIITPILICGLSAFVFYHLFCKSVKYQITYSLSKGLFDRHQK